MKRQMQLFVVIGLLLAGLTACDKEAVVKDQGMGNVSMTFGFSETPEGRAVTASGKKPTTTWKDNVKDLIVLFAKDGVVVEARSVAPPTGADLGEKPVSLKNIPANTDCNIYVIANSGQATNINRPDWNVTNAKGRLVDDLLMQLVTTTVPAELGTGQGYLPPAEIFIATQQVTIQADKDNNITTPFTLTRAVSLIRVRLILKGDNATKINFTETGKASIFLRRVSPSVDVLKNYTAISGTAGVYVDHPFLSIEPTTGYTGTGNILDVGNGITLYRDFICFPGGSETAGPQKFDITIMGTTKDATYIPAGATVPLAANRAVYWGGAINKAIQANQILDVVVTVQSHGDADAPEEPGSYGNLLIQVNLVEWGNVVLTELPV